MKGAAKGLLIGSAIALAIPATRDGVLRLGGLTLAAAVGAGVLLWLCLRPGRN